MDDVVCEEDIETRACEEDTDGRDDDATVAEVGIGARRSEGKASVEVDGAAVGDVSAAEVAGKDGKIHVDELVKDFSIGVAAGKATVEDNDTATGGRVKEDPTAVDGVAKDGVSFLKRRPIKTP